MNFDTVFTTMRRQRFLPIIFFVILILDFFDLTLKKVYEIESEKHNQKNENEDYKCIFLREKNDQHREYTKYHCEEISDKQYIPCTQTH